MKDRLAYCKFECGHVQRIPMVGSRNAVKRARAIYVRRKCHDCVGDPIETIQADAVATMEQQHKIEEIRRQQEWDQERAAIRDRLANERDFLLSYRVMRYRKASPPVC